MFEPWGRHSRLRYLTIDDIHEVDLPRLRKLCEYMPLIRHCRIISQKPILPLQQSQQQQQQQQQSSSRPLSLCNSNSSLKK
ncbi:hypothetical protein GGI08_007789 [Coemansia sp. S2]|nr:hypothetical protein GGI08_007789 [Coemansia sp. S2]